MGHEGRVLECQASSRDSERAGGVHHEGVQSQAGGATEGDWTGQLRRKSGGIGGGHITNRERAAGQIQRFPDIKFADGMNAGSERDGDIGPRTVQRHGVITSWQARGGERQGPDACGLPGALHRGRGDLSAVPVSLGGPWTVAVGHPNGGHERVLEEFDASLGHIHIDIRRAVGIAIQPGGAGVLPELPWVHRVGRVVPWAVNGGEGILGMPLLHIDTRRTGLVGIAGAPEGIFSHDPGAQGQRGSAQNIGSVIAVHVKHGTDAHDRKHPVRKIEAELRHGIISPDIDASLEIMNRH